MWYRLVEVISEPARLILVAFTYLCAYRDPDTNRTLRSIELFLFGGGVKA